MSQITAHARSIRMSARKVRLVADLIRGMDVSSALDQLRVVVKAAKRPIEKLIRSALANAEHNFQLEMNQLKIAKITVDEATRLKRWRPRAFGRAAPIQKHLCHITVVLSESEQKPKASEEPKEKAKKEKSAAPKKQSSVKSK